MLGAHLFITTHILNKIKRVVSLNFHALCRTLYNVPPLWADHTGCKRATIFPRSRQRAREMQVTRSSVNLYGPQLYGDVVV